MRYDVEIDARLDTSGGQVWGYEAEDLRVSFRFWMFMMDVVAMDINSGWKGSL